VTRPARTDLLLAAALLVAVLVEQAVSVGLGWEDALKVPGCLALGWRRSAPLASCPAVIALFGFGEFTSTGDADAFTTFAAIVMALFSLVVHARRDRLVVGATGAAALIVAVSVEAGLNNPLPGETTAEAVAAGVLFGLVVICAPVLAVGLLARRQADLRRRLAERADQLEVERERHATAAATAERARMAGELHDVVDAGVRAMLGEVAAARRMVVRDDRGAAGEAILRVEQRGRDALAEMRALLGVLRRGDEDLALAPQPSLARLDGLARELTGRGLEVALRVEGASRPISAGLDVAAYRLVEEALEHAAGAHRADVVVRWTASGLEVEVGVDGAQLADTARLDGPRERVGLFDGRLEAGRRPRGGSAMRARLPVEAA
jgi:signal transduction histidine kinase